MARPLLDWPAGVIPSKAIIVNVGAVQDGYISRDGYTNDVRIPGGRVRLDMTFDTQKVAASGWYSWLASKLKGNLFRVPLWATVQLARDADLGLPAGYLAKGVPFASGARFSSGTGFRFVPTLETAGAALEGDNTLVLDESRWPGSVAYGKWLGLGMAAYHVEDLERDGTTVTVTVAPTLRRDVEAGEFVSLRPSLICQARDTSSFTAPFDNVDMAQPGQLSMYEVIDEAYL